MTAPFWGFVLAACLVWYSTITFYVGVRGAFDIKHMLARLRALESDVEEDSSP